MLKNLKNKKKKGFTLIELIIVIAIIAILAAIAIPKFGDVRRNAALKSDIANAKIIADGASALIAEGTIVIPLADKTVVIDKNATDSVDDTIATAIEGYLQSVPTPKTSGYTNYKVTVTKEGNVGVSMKNATGDYKLYPDVATGTP